MGTRSDYYIGRGPHAEWLGSLANDGYPEGKHADAVKDAKTPEDFRERLTAHFKEEDRQATLPAMGWPWPWEDSRLTDYSYAFDAGEVWYSCFGHRWRKLSEFKEDDDGEEADDLPKEIFPNMKDRQNVTLGPRSGLIVFTSP